MIRALVLTKSLRVKKHIYFNPVKLMVHDSHFANGKQKVVGDILLAEQESKLSLKPFSLFLAGSRNKYKGLCYTGNRSGGIGLRRVLAFTLHEIGTHCRHGSKAQNLTYILKKRRLC